MSQYLEEVRKLVLPCLTPSERERVKRAKLELWSAPFGTNFAEWLMLWQSDAAGHTVYNPTIVRIFMHLRYDGTKPNPLIGETLIHELGHVVRGRDHGHDAKWAAICNRMGLKETPYGDIHDASDPDPCTMICSKATPELAAKLARLTPPTKPDYFARDYLGGTYR